MSARRAIFLQIIQLIFINCSFAKINTIVFANLQTRCEVARYFFANDQDHFSQLPSCKKRSARAKSVRQLFLQIVRIILQVMDGVGIADNIIIIGTFESGTSL